MPRTNPNNQPEQLDLPAVAPKPSQNIIETRTKAEFDDVVFRRERGEFVVHVMERGSQNGHWKFYISQTKPEHKL